MRLWWRKPRDQADGAGQHLPMPSLAPRLPGSAARRAVKRNPSLSPRDATAAAYVRWMIDLGFGGAETLQDELYDEYEAVCELAGFDPMARKHFGDALKLAGCKRWQTDKERDGKRWRPIIVKLPDECPALIPLPTTDKRVAARNESVSRDLVKRAA